MHSPAFNSAFPYLSGPLPGGESEYDTDGFLIFLLILLMIIILWILWTLWFFRRQDRADKP